MKVGVARESAAGERRVALVPEALGKLTAAGLEILVETGAGAGAAIPDQAFTDAGARIVSTDVNGIAEMLTNTDEAYLVPAGDPFKLATALKAALADHFAGNEKMISMAYARAARNYHQTRALPQHLQVIREAWLG